MTGNSPEWYVAMAEAMKRRERALSMIASWGEKLAEAEREISDLSLLALPRGGEQVQVTGPTEQE